MVVVDISVMPSLIRRTNLRQYISFFLCVRRMVSFMREFERDGIYPTGQLDIEYILPSPVYVMWPFNFILDLLVKKKNKKV